MELTYLDSNTWLIDNGVGRILLDPWLVGPLVFGNLPWLFKAERTVPRSIPKNIDLILLSQGLPDHAHPETLKQLHRNIPVVASPNAAKVVKRLGYEEVTVLDHGETFTNNVGLSIKAVPGSPIGPMLVENGYLIQDLKEGYTIYYEPHGYHSPELQKSPSVNVAITPIVDVKIPLLGAIIKGRKSALQLCQWLKPQVIIPTAAGGDVVFTGLLNALLQTEESESELRSLLKDNKLSTKVVEPIPGTPFRLPLKV